MKNIVAQLAANNQITLRYYSRPNCLKSKNPGDLTAQKDTYALARIQQKLENIDKILSHECKEYEHQNDFDIYGDRNLFERIDLPDLHQVRKASSYVSVLGTASNISGVIEYFDPESSRVVQTNYKELAERKRFYLDIIKKSQHTTKKPRPWGKVQTVKKFTRNAKQKILEAGAVVDRHCDSDSRYELTLTVPGSGIEVYDAVSRYSGYIVNRMAQVIRRLEAKGWDILWFYVWEHQKRGALHQHWCISMPNQPRMAEWLCRQLRLKWFDLLEELSVKTGIDLFQKRGFSGTWRHSPEVWQSNIALVRKSVAAYFSKYLSKNCETTRFNRERRQRQEALRKKHPDRVEYARVISLCPSRYWGCGSRVKQLCRRYRVDVPFRISSEKEGKFIADAILQWAGEVSDKLTKVSRTFKKVAADTGFVYCRGWEIKIWFEADVIDDVLRMFRRLRACEQRKTDGIGAILSMGEY